MITVNESVKKINERLTDWVGSGKVSKVVYSKDKTSAYALVFYEKYADIYFIFNFPATDRASLSCEKSINLPKDEIVRDDVVSAIEDTFTAMLYRWE